MRSILKSTSRRTPKSLTTIWRKLSIALLKSASKSSSFLRLIWPNRTFSMTTGSRFTWIVSLMWRLFKLECLEKSLTPNRSSKSTGNAMFSIMGTKSLGKRAVMSQPESLSPKYTSAARACTRPKTVNRTEWTGISSEIFSRSRTSAWRREGGSRRASTSQRFWTRRILSIWPKLRWHLRLKGSRGCHITRVRPRSSWILTICLTEFNATDRKSVV